MYFLHHYTIAVSYSNKLTILDQSKVCNFPLCITLWHTSSTGGLLTPLLTNTLYGGADRFITSTSDLALIMHHWRLITCRTLISLRLSVMNPPPMKASLWVKSSTRWLTKDVDITVSYPVPVVTSMSLACPAPSRCVSLSGYNLNPYYVLVLLMQRQLYASCWGAGV